MRFMGIYNSVKPYCESMIIEILLSNLSTRFEGAQTAKSTHLLQEGISRCSVWTRYLYNIGHRVDFNFLTVMVAYMANGKYFWKNV